MRILSIAIDGYGLFVRRTLDLDRSLQVIVGPNEQGKSTLRGYIGDMLYGQKRSSTMRRVYEESNELRRPWANPEEYGGRLVYELDDGRTFEIFRRFDKKNEVIQVFDRTNAEDITSSFEQSRNREPLFALAHLGLTKDVFLNAATISHLTLEDLGDTDALPQISEKLLSLADTGEETSSAETALKRLEARIAAIGQRSARTRPLPAARTRLSELNEEHGNAAALRQELAEVDERRRAAREEAAGLRRQHEALQVELGAIDKAERAQRLAEAEELHSRIDEITQRCFTLSAAREFPVDQVPEVQRTEMVLATAKAQAERTRGDLAKGREQLEQERQSLGEAASLTIHEIPAEQEKGLMDLAAGIQRVRDWLDEAASARAAAEERLTAAQETLASLPEFDRLSQDPVSWLTQIAKSFAVAVRSRDDECAELEELADKVRRQEEVVAGPERLFSRCEDFPAEAREYEVQNRMTVEELGRLTAASESLEQTVKEYSERVPGLRWLALLNGAVVIGLLIAQFYLRNPGIYVAAGLAAIAALCFLLFAIYAGKKAASAEQELDETEAKVAQIQAAADAPQGVIEEMMVEARCKTVRELEAKYDAYVKACIELASLKEAMAAQEAKAEEAKQRVAQLLECFRKTFRDLGQEVTEESHVEEAASVAIERYQDYRDAKRRLGESRDQIREDDAETERRKAELDTLLEDERGAALELRRLMRASGFRDEGKHDTPVGALRAYRSWADHLRGKQNSIAKLQSEIEALEARFEEEEQDLQKHTDTLEGYLKAAGVESLDQWRQRAEQAKEYGGLWQKRTSLEEQLASLLRGQSLEELREAVEADGPVPEAPQRSADEVKREIADLDERIDALTKEEHALHIKLTERSAGTRSINEIEEERAAVEARVRELELELNAASHAMALIEQIARDKHSRIAPRLAALASGFLAEITDSAYGELLISRDLSISVRIPQTRQMAGNPERVLSTGTVDQVYLALRLAMVQALSDNGESIPMLLDDPFGSYDDKRLERALELLARLAEKNQILLFTCREDVLRVARAANAPILEL